MDKNIRPILPRYQNDAGSPDESSRLDPRLAAIPTTFLSLQFSAPTGEAPVAHTFSKGFSHMREARYRLRGPFWPNVDDLLAALLRTSARESLLIIVPLLFCLGDPMSWKKVLVEDSLIWSGWKFNC